MHVYKVSINNKKYIVETKAEIPHDHAVSDAEIFAFRSGIKVTLATQPDPEPYIVLRSDHTEAFRLTKATEQLGLPRVVDAMLLMDANVFIVLQSYLSNRLAS